MELKTARLTLLIDPNKKAAFERLCAQLDLTASQVVRQLIRDYLAQHGVSYVPSGHEDAAPPPASPAPDAAPDAAPSPSGRAAVPRGERATARASKRSSRARAASRRKAPP